MISLIAAVSENGVLGKDNQMIWHLPNDFKRFKSLTTGHPVIMGRKTFESLPGILPNREHIIITRNKKFQAENCIVVPSVEEALDYCKKYDKIYIIGGGEIYRQTISAADEIEITVVHTQIDGDTFFPEIDTTLFELKSKEFHSKDEKHAFDYSFYTYIRKPN